VKVDNDTKDELQEIELITRDREDII